MDRTAQPPEAIVDAGFVEETNTTPFVGMEPLDSYALHMACVENGRV